MKTKKNLFLVTVLVAFAMIAASQNAAITATKAQGGGVPGFSKHTVDSNFGGAHSVFAIDLDGDNDTDILGAADTDDDVTWWENDGTPSDGGWTEHTIADNFDGANAVYAADLDDDTDIDVLSVASNGDAVAWWENDGTPADGGWTEHTINDSFGTAYDVYAADVDGDDDMDVLGAAWADDDITWWENDGTPADGGWTEHIIDGSFDGAHSVYATDVDDDDDVDVIGGAANASDVTWWENDGTPADGGWTEHTIDSYFYNVFSVYAADLDGDDDIDVVGAAFGADDIAWWENDGTPVDGGWTEHTVDGNFDGAFYVYTADINNDTNLDIVAVARLADEVAWWENDGTPGDGGWTKHTVDGAFDNPYSVYAADVNSDGDMDVLGAAFDGDEIAWWEQGTFYLVYAPLILRNAGPPTSAPVLNPINNPSGNYDYDVSWGAVDKATTYTLEEDDNAGFASPTTVYSGSGLSTSITGQDLGTYYYRVKASNSFGESDWSNVESTTVTVEKPACPQAGSWSGTTSQGRPISFDVVNTPSCRVENLTIQYRYTCTSGSYYVVTTVFYSTQSITNNHFDTGGDAPRVWGDFTSTTAADGNFSYSGWDPYNPIYSCSASGTWTTSYSSQTE